LILEEGSRIVVLDRDVQLLVTLEDQHSILSGAILADISEPTAAAETFMDLDDLSGASFSEHFPAINLRT
jgi:hypothetical protein